MPGPMNTKPALSDSPSPAKTMIGVGVGTAILLALVFLPAGRLDWLEGWLYITLLELGWWTNHAVVARRNPDVLRRRGRRGEGVPGWDRHLMAALRLAIVAVFVVGGLDAGRYGWSEAPWLLWGAGVGFHLLGYALLTWSMAANAHFEGFVRIQPDVAHRVVAEGPYRHLRHPGYVGFTLILLAIPLLLRSWWALLPAMLGATLLLARTAREDRFLRAKLPGYADYARRVRFRLLPGIW